MRRALVVMALVATGCGGSGLRGWYPVPGSSDYGFEFRDGGVVLSRVGDDIGRGTFSVEGSKVLICFGSMCDELVMVGDCLVQDSTSRYCKET